MYALRLGLRQNLVSSDLHCCTRWEGHTTSVAFVQYWYGLWKSEDDGGFGFGCVKISAMADRVLPKPILFVFVVCCQTNPHACTARTARMHRNPSVARTNGAAHTA